MEKKYYDLIITIIKNNRKYPGLEPILDEIANHVFEQAKAVFNNIDDSSVIEAYLEKIVKTAIVTVPRKLGYKTAREERKSVIQIQKVEIKEQKDSLDIKNEVVNESIEENLFTEDYDSGETLKEYTSEENPEMEDTSSTEKVLVDVELVDKMINGVNKTTDITDNTQDIEEDTLELYESLENFEEFDNETDYINTDNVEPDNIEQEAEENTIEEDDELDNTTDLNFEIEEIAEEPQNESLEIDFDTNLEDFEVEEVQDEEEYKELSLDATTEIEEFDTIEEKEDLAQNFEVSSEDLIEEAECFEVNEIEVAQGSSEEKNTTKFYNLFNFEPSTTEDFSDELLEKIKDLNSKFPEKHILEICKLKYNQNLSVKEISEHINLEISCIIEALNEIIDAIKD